MISFIFKSSNCLNQIQYDRLTNNLNYHQFKCKCNGSSDFVKHGYYKRMIKTPLGKISIIILRIKCKSCDCTHAILPSNIIPYSQITLDDHLNIIINLETNKNQAGIMENNPEIDESNIKFVIRKYINFWKEKLRSYSINITKILNVDVFIKNIYQIFKSAFMQNKKTYFYLNITTT